MQTGTTASNIISIQKEYNIVGVSKYGNCRCCLSIGLHQHTFGINEMDILMENLNIFLLADARLPKLICSKCITSLEEVQRFRQKVIASEAELHRVIIQGVNHDTTMATLQPTLNDPLDMNVVKTEEDHDSLDAQLKVVPDDDNIDDSHQNESSTDVGPSDVKVEREIVAQNQLDHYDLAGTSFKTVKVEYEMEASEKIKTMLPFKPVTLAPERNVLKRKMVPETQNVIPLKYDRPPNEFINIGNKLETATFNTIIRANLILILQNSTILPFRITKSNYFKCYYCEQIFKLFKGLRSHTNMEHKCGVNDYTIFKWMQVRQHKNVHADISDMKCKICDLKIETIEDLVTHLTEVHNKVYHDVKEDEKHKGPKHRVLGVHLDSDTFKCHICQKEFRIYKHLTSHMSDHYDSYACPKCDKKFVTSLRYKDHLMSHDYSATKCPECEKVFKTKHLMRAHRYNIHIRKDRNISKCTECSETFLWSQQLKKIEHMETAHGIKKHVYKCDDCEKSYFTVKSLHHHKTTVHIRANEMVCEMCGYRTTIRRVMRNHMDYHNGVKKFECEYCQKKFATKFSMELHIRMHTNNKQYACTVCDAAFIQKHCLQRHIKSRHPESGIDLTKLSAIP